MGSGYEICKNCLQAYNQLWHTWCPDCGKNGELYGKKKKPASPLKEGKQE